MLEVKLQMHITQTGDRGIGQFSWVHQSAVSGVPGAQYSLGLAQRLQDLQTACQYHLRDPDAAFQLQFAAKAASPLRLWLQQ